MAVAAILLTCLAASAVYADSDWEREFDFSRPIYNAASSRPYRRHLMNGQGSPLPDGGYPSPSPSPSPEGAGELSPSPSPAPQTCSGVAYDGYLSNCELKFTYPDSDATSAIVTVVDGKFDTSKPAILLGAGYLTPAPADTARSAGSAGQTIGFCYDTVTRLPEVLPLATPAPSDCSKPIVVDIASTLLQYGIEYEAKSAEGNELFTEEALKKAFAFADSIDIGHYDAIAASTDPATKAEGLAVLKSQAHIRNCLQIIAQSFTAESNALAQVSKEAFVALASHVMDTRQERKDALNPPETRRRLQALDELPLDLSKFEEIKAIIAKVEDRIQQAVANGLIDTNEVSIGKMTASVTEAISRAVATINTITSASTTFAEVQKATQVVLTTLTTEVQQLVTSGDVAAFDAKTSETSLREAVSSAKLEGEIVEPPPTEEDGSSNKGALIGGLVGGLGGGLLLISAIAGYIIYKRRNATTQ